MSEQQQHLVETMEALGIPTEGKSFEECVVILITEHIQLMSEIETDNIAYFKKELIRIITKETN